MTSGTSGTFVLQSLSAGLLLLVNLLLARVLGVAAFGDYAYALAWAGLLVIPATLGQGHLIAREAARSMARREWSRLAGLLHWSRSAVGTLSVVLAAGIAVAAGLLSDPPLGPTILVVALAIPFLSLTTVHTAALRGLGHVLSAQIPETLVRPVLLLGLVGLFATLDGRSAVSAAALHVCSCGAALVAAVLLLRRSLPAGAKHAVRERRGTAWFAASVPFILIAGVQAVNMRTDTLMLGAIRGTAEAGVFFAASRIAAFGAFVLMVVNRPLGPEVVQRHVAGDRDGLQRVVKRSCRLVLVGTLPVVVAQVLAGEPLLRWFGDGFESGYGALLILCGAQLVNAAAGPVALLLNMTGHERTTLFALCVSAITNVALNAILIPPHGLVGAALATAASLILWNVVLAVRVSRKLGIRCTPF